MQGQVSFRTRSSPQQCQLQQGQDTGAHRQTISQSSSSFSFSCSSLAVEIIIFNTSKKLQTKLTSFEKSLWDADTTFFKRESRYSDSFHSEELHHVSEGSALLSHARRAAVGYIWGRKSAPWGTWLIEQPDKPGHFKETWFICIQQDVLYCIQIMLPTWGIFIVVFMTLLDLNKAIQLVSPASNL